MHTIQQRVEQVQQHISQLTTRPITLMVASKYHSITAIQAAYATGLSDFGENTLQTALPKIQTLSHLSITWHFIGRLQSNKIKRIAQHFDWIHSVATPADIIALTDATSTRTHPLNLCIQVGLCATESRRCCLLQNLESLLNQLKEAPTLKIRGLMCLPPATLTTQRAYFETLHKTFTHLAEPYQLDTLCMGMSQDYPEAIRAGATMIRLGTAILGPKPQFPQDTV